MELLPLILSAAFGGRIPQRAIALLCDIVPAAIKLIKSLREVDEEGTDKRIAAIEALREFIDNECDDIPEWSALGEDRRDRILSGLIELVLWVVELEDLHGDRKGRALLRNAILHLKQRSKSS
jgi:hypothetical protein